MIIIFKHRSHCGPDDDDAASNQVDILMIIILFRLFTRKEKNQIILFSQGLNFLARKEKTFLPVFGFFTRKEN